MKLLSKILCTLAIASSPLCFAASVTYDFAGTLNGVSRSLSPDLSRGDSFFGSFSVNGSDQSARTHRNIIDGSLNVGGMQFQFTDYDLRLSDNSFLDRYLVFNGLFSNGGITGPSVGGRSVSSLRFIFSDWCGWDDVGLGGPDGVNGLSSNQLLQLALFDSSRVVLGFGNKFARGDIDSLSAVPLPAGVWLFVSGLIGLFAHRKIQKKKGNPPIFS